LSDRMRIARGLLRQVAIGLLGLVPSAFLQRALAKLAIGRAIRLNPAEGLRFLFGLEAAIYPVEGQLSIAYDGRLHTKHRHTRYHDFFVHRIEATDRVLDVGCGVGALAYDVADRAGATVVGIDISAERVDEAQRKHAHERTAYSVGDALEQLPAGEFDVVILSNVLEHLPARPSFLTLLASQFPASRLLIRVPLFERDWRVPLRKELGVEWRLDPTHETEYTLESFAEEINAAGLGIVYQEVRWGEIWAEVRTDDAAD
jgi:SAM-dependent methyltransferase